MKSTPPNQKTQLPSNRKQNEKQRLKDLSMSEKDPNVVSGGSAKADRLELFDWPGEYAAVTSPR